MAKQISAAKFAAFLKRRLAARDGYIFGATGQNPKKLPAWYFTGQYSGAQLKKALYWRKHAKRVWDCNGLAEGYYKQKTGVDINARARDNYRYWCNPRGEGKIPPKYRVPGAAVFKHSGYIHHVGFLVEPVVKGKPEGDWYVIEARGVNSGVIRSRLSQNNWNRWGLMTRYFKYAKPIRGRAATEASAEEGAPEQEELRGDAGDGSPEVRIRVTAETAAYVRSGPGTQYSALTTVPAGAELDSPEQAGNGWRRVSANGEAGWISPRMFEVISNG